MMKAISSATVIHIQNIKASIEYYTQVLGFTEDFIFGEYAGLFLDEVFIHLCGVENQGIKKAPGSAHLCIDLQDVDAYYQAIIKNGAEILIALEDRVYGMRDFALNDPDGNTLVFGSPVAATIHSA